MSRTLESKGDLSRGTCGWRVQWSRMHAAGQGMRPGRADLPHHVDLVEGLLPHHHRDGRISSGQDSGIGLLELRLELRGQQARDLARAEAHEGALAIPQDLERLVVLGDVAELQVERIARGQPIEPLVEAEVDLARGLVERRALGRGAGGQGEGEREERAEHGRALAGQLQGTRREGPA